MRHPFLNQLINTRERTMSKENEMHEFLCKKFNVNRVADDIGTEINLQYVFEAMEEYAEFKLDELKKDVEGLTAINNGKYLYKEEVLKLINNK